MVKLAVIIPIYNESEAIQKNFAMIHQTLLADHISCHYMIVDDGSTDQTWLEICEIVKKYDHVSAIRFARNFGKEMALCAGIDHIQAQRYLIMDSDLQHPPQCIKDMILLMDKTQVNIVHGVKKPEEKKNGFINGWQKFFIKYYKE